ncbi:MAG: tripartite tricarboxylate transporter TctB family protein [Candidatus Rokubacteria bacterium]|nr:tripartite tricarboxylate transporter TctB family protein [Candidatus Rokubacteria bacterium]
MLGRDGWAGLVCLGGSLGLLALTRGLPQPALVPIGPGFYPRLVLGSTALLSAMLVIADLLARRREGRTRRGRAPGPGPAARSLVPAGWALVLTTFGLFAAYVLLLPGLGYRLGTFLFVGALQTALEPPGRRRWLLIVVVAAATAWVTHLVFESYLSVLLPRGRWTAF